MALPQRLVPTCYSPAQVLATYNASGTVSGIDDRSILAVLVSALKQIWVKVLALVQSDEAQNARIEQLEAEVAALKSQSAAASAPGSTSSVEAPGGSSASRARDDADPRIIPKEDDDVAPSSTAAANDNPPPSADEAGRERDQAQEQKSNPESQPEAT